MPTARKTSTKRKRRTQSKRGAPLALGNLNPLYRLIKSVSPDSQVTMVRQAFAVSAQYSNDTQYMNFKAHSYYQQPNAMSSSGGSGTAADPMGLVQLQAIYSRFRVLSSKITVSLTGNQREGNTDLKTALLTLSLQQATGVVDGMKAIENGKTSYCIINAKDTVSKRLRASYNPTNFYGSNAVHTSGLDAAFGADPSVTAYFQFRCQPAVAVASSGATFSCIIVIQYILHCFDKIMRTS